MNIEAWKPRKKGYKVINNKQRDQMHEVFLDLVKKLSRFWQLKIQPNLKESDIGGMVVPKTTQQVFE